MNQGLSTWETRLAEQVKRKYQNYKPLRLKLDDALTDKEFPGLAGDALIVIAASSANALATVKLNATANDSITLKLGRKISTIFTKLYFSCTAQAGEWLDIIAGIDFDLDDLGDLLLAGTTQPAIIVTNATPDTSTQCVAHSCKAILVKAQNTNTDLVWVNVGAAAVEGSCYPLAAGEIMPAPCNNTSDIHALFKVANERITILYRV